MKFGIGLQNDAVWSLETSKWPWRRFKVIGCRSSKTAFLHWQAGNWTWIVFKCCAASFVRVDLRFQGGFAFFRSLLAYAATWYFEKKNFSKYVSQLRLFVLLCMYVCLFVCVTGMYFFWTRSWSQFWSKLDETLQKVAPPGGIVTINFW